MQVVLSKAYAAQSKFKGTDFTNAIIDRAVFTNADFTGAVSLLHQPAIV